MAKTEALKTIKLYLQEIGIIFSYIYLLIASYVFDWKPFSIFFSSLAEVIVLFLIYCLLRVIDQNNNPSKYRKSQPLINAIIGIIPLIGIQALFILLTSGSVTHDKDFMRTNPFLTKEVLYCIISTLIVYGIKAFQIKGHQERVDQFQGNFIFKAISITATSMLAMIIITCFEVKTLFPVLSAVVILRICLELYFLKKMKLM